MARAVEDYEAYYEGRRRLDAIGVSLPPNVRVLEMPVRWPKLTVDVLVRSLVLEGFTMAGGEVPHELHRILQANNFDSLLTLTLTEALVTGRAWVVAGGSIMPGSNIPRLSAHRGRDIVVKRDIFGTIAEAVQTYTRGGVEQKAVYTPGHLAVFAMQDGEEALIEEHDYSDTYPGVPIVEVVNRTRIGSGGTSEIEDIIELCDAASRSLTNLQIAQELLAMPTRYLFGDGVADQFTGDGRHPGLARLEAHFGHLLVGPSGSQAGSIPGADLQQIINSFRLYAAQVSAMTGIPASMMGVSSDSNPTSAEAMRAAKDGLISRAELKQHLFGDAVEEIARMVLQMAGVKVEGLETLEARWRDPAVASISSRNALMLQAQAQGVITSQTAREFLGLSPEQAKREDSHDSEVRAALGEGAE